MSSGREVHFKKFWNERALEICSNDSVVFYTSRTLCKTNILLVEVEELNILYKEIHPDAQQRLKSVSKLVDRLEKAHFTVSHTYKTVAESDQSTTEDRMK